MNKELILRLTKYKRILHKLKALGLQRVFSNNLGDAIGVAPSLVRKDFSLLHFPGNKRGGYQIDKLIKMLDNVLGRDKPQDVVVVGCGRIGTALLNFYDFNKDGIKIVAGFDANPENVENKTEIPIFGIEKITEFVREKNIQVGVIAVPDNATSGVFEILVNAGIKGILNFSSVDLKNPSKKLANDDKSQIWVHNLNIGLEIEHIFYQINLSEADILNVNSENSD